MYRGSFYQVLSDAIRDMLDHGFDSPSRLKDWIERIREAAKRSLIPEAQVERQLKAAFRATYTRLIEREGILRTHPSVSKFTLQRVAPSLRAELDRRIMASAELIRMNRAAAIERTLQRFSGWATSIPVAGSSQSKAEPKAHIRKELAQLPFEERRVAIDQGHKFSANLSDILATHSGAIAGRWQSHWRQSGYQYREDHKERDGQVYVVRGNWALEQGLMKLAGHQYTDQIEMPAELIYCRCWYSWVYSIRDLPPEMLTAKGRAALQK